MVLSIAIGISSPIIPPSFPVEDVQEKHGYKRYGVTLNSSIFVLRNTGLTPVHWFSHGSTMMLGEECESATYWKKCGDAALATGINGVVMRVMTSEVTVGNERY